MSSITDYKGLAVLDSATGAGGEAINDDFKLLADRAGPVHEAATNPTANDDQNDSSGNGRFYTWSKWRNTSDNKVFICVDPSTGSAVWVDVSEGGDVMGPSSATDAAVAIYDGTDGKTLKNSDLVISGDSSLSRGTSGEAVAIKSNAAGGSALFVDGSASQSANLQEWRNSAGTKLAAIGPDGELNFGAATQLTISSGEVTVAKSYHTVETEGGASSDNLDSINGGIEGDVLAIRPASSDRTVVAKAGTGNLLLNGDYTMDDAEDTLTLLFDGSNWLELSRSAIAGGGGAPTDAEYWVETANGSLSAEVVVGTTGITTAAYGSRQAAAKSGRLFLPNNGFVLERDSGAGWSPWGPIFPFTSPVSGDYSWVNQSTASIATSNGGVYLLGPSTFGSDNFRIRVKSSPSTPYTITIAFLVYMVHSSFPKAGFVFRQSSDGKLVAFCLDGNQIGRLGVFKYNSPTSWNSTYTTVDLHPLNPIVWLQVSDDGTNRVCRASADGQFWHEIHSVGRTNFLTANEVGFFVSPSGSTGPCSMTLLHWRES